MQNAIPVVIVDRAGLLGPAHGGVQHVTVPRARIANDDVDMISADALCLVDRDAVRKLDVAATHFVYTDRETYFDIRRVFFFVVFFFVVFFFVVFFFLFLS